MRLLLVAALSALPLAAQYCGPNDLLGPYGFQLYGPTTLSGTPKPMAAIGRLVFDEDRRVSGVSSVNFDGWFLGNPVTGTYELKPNCTMTWSLQDDSGAWQHFRGTVRPGGNRGEFRQTDPGTDGRGILQRSADGCSAASLRGTYSFTMAGVSTPLSPQGPGFVIFGKTLVEADGNGNLTLTTGENKNSGTYEVDSDCFVTLNFGIRLRGIIVNGGRTVLAVQTDPQQVAVATFNLQ